MRKLIIGLILVILMMVTVSCTSESKETEDEETKPLLTAEQKEQLAETGAITVSTLEEASRLAGYTVVTPTFLPGDYRRGEIIVGQLGLPIELGGEWGDGIRHVDQMWGWSDFPSARLMLIQIPGAEREETGEPVDICGRPGWKEIHEEGRKYPLLGLRWHENGRRFSLSGTLTEPLTEEILLQIACSVTVE